MRNIHNRFRYGHGEIWLDCINQGRIFAEMDGEILQRFDFEVAKNPDPVNFNNIGGNSLWPAPEGGEYAFNYPAGPKPDWWVQPGVNHASSTLLPGELPATCKRVTLVNRKGVSLEVEFWRRVFPLSNDELLDFPKVRFTGYREEDRLTLSTACSPEQGVIAAWSLEQFPGSRDILTFGKTAGRIDGQNAINRSYYGDPGDCLESGPGFFRFRSAGNERYQIGVRASCAPEFIGAWDSARELLMVRCCLPGVGRRIDIADNSQESGIFGAEDQYSIFLGGSLNFFELEAIAPVQFTPDGLVAGSELHVESRFYRGPKKALERLLQDRFGMPDSFLS